MVWDKGTAAGESDDHKFILRGKRLKGSWVLVRTRGREGECRRGQWLLIKHRDDAADPEIDPVADYLTSAQSGRTMEEIAEATSEEAQ